MRGQNFDAETGTFIYILNYFACVIKKACKKRRKKFAGIMAFQPRSLIGNISIGCGVSFIESIGSKRYHFVKDFIGGFFICTAPDSALTDDIAVFINNSVNKICALFKHNIMLLFAHGAPDYISSAV